MPRLFCDTTDSEVLKFRARLEDGNVLGDFHGEVKRGDSFLGWSESVLREAAGRSSFSVIDVVSRDENSDAATAITPVEL